MGHGRLVLLAFVVVVATCAGGCSTVIKPTRPSNALAELDAPPTGLRFDGEEVALREPGMPVSPSRTWQREVQNYTASQLSSLLGENETGPVARTIVTFDLAAPSSFQIGTWKEMTIGLTTTLPSGVVVKSEPVVGNIDDPIEYAGATALGVGGTILDVTAGVASIFFLFDRTPTSFFIFAAALVGGLTLNIAQSGAQYLVAASEEVRWSDLFQRALVAHARDIRAGLLRPAPTPLPQANPNVVPPLSRDPVDPPPPLLDPAEPDAAPPAATPSTPSTPSTGTAPPAPTKQPTPPSTPPAASNAAAGPTVASTTTREAKPVLVGSLDPEEIRRIVRSHSDEIRACYEAELAETPGIGGKVIMKWTIGADGLVVKAGVGETQMKNNRVEDCLAKLILAWSFPKPKGGGIVIVNYPFVFRQT
jgi:outer membrane biosynthesis protein TonB